MKNSMKLQNVRMGLMNSIFKIFVEKNTIFVEEKTLTPVKRVNQPGNFPIIKKLILTKVKMQLK